MIDAERGTRRAAESVVDAALVVLSLCIIAGALLIVLVFVDDRYGVGHVPGTWMALAAETLEGRFYPPLAEDGYFAGTRYMPIPIVALAGAAAVTGEVLVSSKTLAALTTASLLIVLWLVLRRVVQCSRPVSLALTASVLAAPPGLLAASSYRGDALPVALQLGALGLVASSPPIAVGAAGVLAGLAFLSKLSALWALAAGAVWLAIYDRRKLSVFVGSAVATVIVGLAASEAMSGGRMSQNLVELSLGTGTDQTISPLSAISATVHLVPWTTWLVSALAGTSIVLAIRARTFSVFQLALVVEVAILVFLFTDLGSDFNHLIDVTVLVAVVAGELARRVASARRWTRPAFGLVLAAALAVGLIASMRTDVVEAARTAIGEPRRSAVRMDELAPFVRGNVLSEHPGIEAELGRRPRVLDPFMLIRIASIEGTAVQALERRIREGYFESVLLLLPLDEYPERYRRTAFGQGISAAIASRYCRGAHLGTPPYDIWVYRRC